MCGIAGIVAATRVSTDAVSRMNDIQRHRGPDGDGLWRSECGRSALGHRRLAIIDLSSDGHQPMRHGALTITYNGEIYNYVEVREKLERLGRVFRSASDTEVLLQAYSLWGTDCLRELNGMFAFAIWDDERKTLFCARDRFGEKPFLYSATPSRFAFASEAKAIALLDDVDLGIADEVLCSYFRHESTAIETTEQTLVRGIKQLLPAHALLLTVDEAGPRIDRIWCWWQIDIATRHAPGRDSEQDSARQLLALLTDSVRLRLRSDVPVGSCLSGGLDSSAVVCLMRRLEPNADLRTFTGRFPNELLDEGHYAKLVSDACRTRVFEVAPTPERFEADAYRVYWHAELPIGGMSQFAQWCVFHRATEGGATVLLDGQGSDEILGGYGNSIVRAYLAGLAARGAYWRWARERRVWAKEAPAQFSWPRLLLGQPAFASLRTQLRAATGRSMLDPSQLAEQDWLQGCVSAAPADAVAEPHGIHALSHILHALSFRTMLSSLLRFGDRLSMAHSREVRLPFCDHRIAEFAFSLSPELLVGGGEVKRVLRRAIHGLVPEDIVTRPKQGFIPPQQRWLAGPLAKWLRELVHAAGPRPLDGRLDVRQATRLAEGDAQIRVREATATWHVVNLLAWHRFSLERMRTAQRVGPLEKN